LGLRRSKKQKGGPNCIIRRAIIFTKYYKAHKIKASMSRVCRSMAEIGNAYKILIAKDYGPL
jgi:hypothetical protein